MMGEFQHLRVTYEFLKQATGNFSNEIGRTSRGVVYKGQAFGGQDIAVKRIILSHDKWDTRDIDRLVSIYAKIRHPNIVQLWGYCSGKDRKDREIALCYEYMHNGSLEEYLYDDRDHVLGWRERYRIIKGTCEGLKCFHMDFEKPLLHLNLKQTNILLDKNLVPKIADFGVDTYFPLGPGDPRRNWDELDYYPPENTKGPWITKECDIFSLGVIIIKIMVGHKGYSLVSEMDAHNFIEHVCNKWMTRLAAIPRYRTLDADYQLVKKCIEIALRCISKDRDKRPTIGEIVEQLNQSGKHINDSAVWTEEVVQTSKEETVNEVSGFMEFNILERIVNGNEKPSHLDLALLQRITENFSEKKKIGSGGCGIVYKGNLPNGVVAVKRLFNFRTIKDTMFHREVTSLISVQHQNIVRFLGYCSFTEEHAILSNGKHIMADVRERLICFEYIRNGSLEKHLTDELRGLEWQTRYQIIIGICRGLHYLHKDKGIIHMDLKPGNILLDDLMVPKITDFGLSRPDTDSHATATRLISRGYAAPEYILGGKATKKSDIYSLGVIIMELVTGSGTKPNITKVLRRWNHRWIKSMKQTSLGYQQVTKCLELAIRCMQHDPTNRPDISDIIDELEKIDNTDSQTQIQINPCCLEDILGIEPLEICIPFEDLKTPDSIELTNDTEDYIAFITKAKLRRFYTEPDKGIVPPRSKYCVTLAMEGRVNAQPNEHYTEVISVMSTRVDNETFPAMDIFVDSEEGKVVDEVKVMVVFGTPELQEEEES